MDSISSISFPNEPLISWTFGWVQQQSNTKPTQKWWQKWSRNVFSTRKLWHTSSFSLEHTDFKNSLSPFWGCQGRRGQTTSKLKITKILNENPWKLDEIQNLASATSKMASSPQGSQKGLSEFFQKIHFWNQGKALRKMSYNSTFWSNFENYQFLTLWGSGIFFNNYIFEISVF